MNLHTIQINELVIPVGRQRQEFLPEQIVELASSISTNGLLHPIVIRKDNGVWTLVSGERRIKAILYLWQFGERLRCGVNESTGEPNWFEEGNLPAVYLGELDELAAEEAELEENIRRENLTWQEQAAANSRLATLRTKIALRDGKEPPTIAELTEEVKGTKGGRPQEDTRRELIVARFLDDPEVAAAKSTNEAFKILKHKEAIQKNIQLATEIGKTFSAAMHRLENVDSIIWLSNHSTAASDNYDIILSDPPYGMGADKFGDSDGMAFGAHRYTDSYEFWKKLVEAACPQLFRIAKPQAHCYLFCDLDHFHELRALMQQAGWRVFRTPLIWHKPNSMRAPWPQSGPFRRYELILFAVKGDKPVTRLYPDVVSYSADENLDHHAQKPVALFIDLLRRSCKPGDTVLDFACGSGTIFPACHEMQCRATGLEIDPAAYGLAAKRLGELK